MSRVWRDGQRKPCHIYRLITTGTLEEKIYQRQRAKGDIASMTVGQGGATGTGGVGKQLSSKNGQFSKEELRQLFTLRTDTACDTSDVLAAAGGEYSFVDVSATCDDAPLAAAVAQSGLVSFVLLEQRHGGKEEAEAAVKTGSGADREAVPCMDSGDASQLEVDDDWE